jgi:hypothetical protein
MVIRHTRCAQTLHPEARTHRTSSMHPPRSQRAQTLRQCTKSLTFLAALSDFTKSFHAAAIRFLPANSQVRS